MEQNQSTSGDSSAVDFDKVFTEELRHIGDGTRRKEAGRPDIWFPEGWIAEPSVNQDLRGLALSGGGIRSATFNLGLLQALGEHDGLKWCDYLSTVSGGGYIGSCLTSFLTHSNNGGTTEEFPFLAQDTEESPEVKHLRQHSNYLAPRHGLFRLDSWRLVSHYLMGLLLSLAGMFALMVLPFIPIIVLLKCQPQLFLRSALYAMAVWGIFSIGSYGLGYVEQEGRRWRNFLGRVQAVGLSLACFFIVLWGLPSLFEYIKQAYERQSPAVLALATPLLSLVKPQLLGEKADTRSAAFARVLVLVGTWSLVVAVWLLVLFFLWKDPGLSVSSIRGDLVLLILLGVVFHIDWFSMLSFYRDRLAEVYIIRRTKPDKQIEREDGATGDLVPQDKLLLSDAKSPSAPLHLINTTVNLPGSENPKLCGRHSDFFLLSPLYSGSPTTKYQETDKYGASWLTLVHAMAISGAATNPQYGPSTHRALTFLMALLNVRLGAWVRNPQFDFPSRSTSGYLVAQLRRFWPYYLIKELLGLVTERSRFVNLSDGGHIENLGVYELLRRRCRLIVASDVGADPGMEFEDLGNLMRKARIDLGVEIKVDIKLLKRDAQTNLSQCHAVVWTIRYPNNGSGEEEGNLIYVKSTLIEDDPKDLHVYQKQHSAFPHESTADQFFDEAQFESYRMLGYCAGKQVIDLLSAQGVGGFSKRPKAMVR